MSMPLVQRSTLQTDVTWPSSPSAHAKAALAAGVACCLLQCGVLLAAGFSLHKASATSMRAKLAVLLSLKL
jgi:hypothetical protein